MTATQKPYKGVAMEGPMAAWYAKNTIRDRRRFQDAARTVIERTVLGAAVLEVAPGPGYLAIAMAKSGRQVTALDISRTFVEMGSENARKAGVQVDFRHGNASAMPLGDESFDYVVCMAAFKNFTDPVGAINEMHRVLEPGGEACILDLRKDASMIDVNAEMERMQLSRWDSIVTRLIFRFVLLKRAYTREDLERMARASNFRRWAIRAVGIGFELRLFKD